MFDIIQFLHGATKTCQIFWYGRHHTKTLPKSKTLSLFSEGYLPPLKCILIALHVKRNVYTCTELAEGGRTRAESNRLQNHNQSASVKGGGEVSTGPFVELKILAVCRKSEKIKEYSRQALQNELVWGTRLLQKGQEISSPPNISCEIKPLRRAPCFDCFPIGKVSTRTFHHIWSSNYEGFPRLVI